MSKNTFFNAVNKEVYDTPRITVIDFDANILTDSPAYDPNQGEWDVEWEVWHEK